MKSLVCLLIFFTLTSAAMAANNFANEVFKSTSVAGSIYMLEGAGGNITALIGPEGVLLVDDDFAPMAGKLVNKLKELKGDSPRFIVNTHFHYDHTGGNEIFGTTATIIAATAVRTRLQTEQILWHETHPAEPPQAWPSLTFDRSLTLHVNGETVRVVHFANGHTDGDTVVFFSDAKVASMGDLYFAGMYPIFHPEHNGSLSGYLANIEVILKRIPEGTKIVPGHGPLASRAELVRYGKMIRASIQAVKSGIRAGHSLERIQKTGLPKEWEDFSHGYLSTDKWLALVYKNLHSAAG